MKKPEKSLLFIGLIWARQLPTDVFLAEITGHFGPIVVFSRIIPFNFSDYYTPEMGTDLQRQWLGLGCQIAPEDIRRIKIITNQIEQQLAIDGRRRVNLDPGYITLSRVVLATTKDYSHRIYLGDGIYAEVTLRYQNGSYFPLPWTYPDYRLPVAGDFFLQMRDLLRQPDFPGRCFT